MADLMRKLLDPEETRRRRRLRARVVHRTRVRRELAEGKTPQPFRKPVLSALQQHAQNDLLPVGGLFNASAAASSSTFGAAPANAMRKTANKTFAYGGSLASVPMPSNQHIRSPSPAQPEPSTKSAWSKLGQTGKTEPHGENDLLTTSLDHLPRNGLLEALPASDKPETPSSSLVPSGGIVLPGLAKPAAAADAAAVAALEQPRRTKARWQALLRRILYAHHEKILAKDPKRPWRQERYGYLLYEDHIFDKVVDHLELAISFGCKPSSRLWKSLARSYFHLWQQENDKWYCQSTGERQTSTGDIQATTTAKPAPSNEGPAKEKSMQTNRRQQPKSSTDDQTASLAAKLPVAKGGDATPQVPTHLIRNSTARAETDKTSASTLVHPAQTEDPEARTAELLNQAQKCYEQALTFFECTCSPSILFEYGQVLEAQGQFRVAQSALESIMTTFPRFDRQNDVILRHLALERYMYLTKEPEIFGELQSQQQNHDEALTPTSTAGPAIPLALEWIMRLRRATDFAGKLLLEKPKALVRMSMAFPGSKYAGLPKESEGIEAKDKVRGVMALYLHARFHELLHRLDQAVPQHHKPIAKAKVSTSDKPKTSAIDDDESNTAIRSYDELYRLAVKYDVMPALDGPLTTATWRKTVDTFEKLADYFETNREWICAVDSLIKALELLDSTSCASSPATLPPTAADHAKRPSASEAPTHRAALMARIGRSLYACKQKNDAVEWMAKSLALDYFNPTMRQYVRKWCPERFQKQLDHEDLSQIQIARIVRGVRARTLVAQLHTTNVAQLERRFLLNPYNSLLRRQIVRVLRDKYATLFAVQELATRSIQKQVREYLKNARIRWSHEEHRSKYVKDLRSKFATRKYRFNKNVRRELEKLFPREFEWRFQQEEDSAITIQRVFRGHHARQVFARMLKAARHRQQQQLRRDQAALRIKQWMVQQHRNRLYRVQRHFATLQKKYVVRLQRQFRLRKDFEHAKMLFHVMEDLEVKRKAQNRLHKHNSACKIQRNWRRYLKRRDNPEYDEVGSLEESCTHSFRVMTTCVVDGQGLARAKELLEQLRAAHSKEKAIEEHKTREHAARRIQALYRGRSLRFSLREIKRLVASAQPSPIARLIDSIMQSSWSPRRTGRSEPTPAPPGSNDENRKRWIWLEAIATAQHTQALLEYQSIILTVNWTCSSANADGTDSAVRMASSSLSLALHHSAEMRRLVFQRGSINGKYLGQLFDAVSNANANGLRVFALGNLRVLQEDSDDDADDEENEGIGEEQSKGTTSDQARKNMINLSMQLNPEFEEEEEDIEQTPDTARSARERSLPSSHARNHLGRFCAQLKTSNYVLEELYFEATNAISNQDAICLATSLGDYFFGRYGHLRKVVLVKLQLRDHVLPAFAKALEINTVLQWLDFHGNYFQDEGACQLALGLARNATLTYLNLANNNIACDGARAIFRELLPLTSDDSMANDDSNPPAAVDCTMQSHLEHLVLCNNHLRNEAVPDLLRLLRSEATRLQQVDLRGNLIKAEHLSLVDSILLQRSASSSFIHPFGDNKPMTSCSPHPETDPKDSGAFHTRLIGTFASPHAILKALQEQQIVPRLIQLSPTRTQAVRRKRRNDAKARKTSKFRAD